MRPQAQVAQTQAGFSLLELLVAFAIMAVALGMIYSSMGSSTRQAGELMHRQQALMLAQSLLSQRDAVTAQGWQESGQSDVYEWHIDSEPDPANAAGALPLHRVTVRVSWPSQQPRQSIKAQTLLPQRQSGPGETTR